MNDCAKHGHRPRVVGRPGNNMSAYVCSACGDWKMRFPPEPRWHSAFVPMPVLRSLDMNNGERK